jgi:hypothetical protein
VSVVDFNKATGSSRTRKVNNQSSRFLTGWTFVPCQLGCETFWEFHTFVQYKDAHELTPYFASPIQDRI